MIPTKSQFFTTSVSSPEGIIEMSNSEWTNRGSLRNSRDVTCSRIHQLRQTKTLCNHSTTRFHSITMSIFILLYFRWKKTQIYCIRAIDQNSFVGLSKPTDPAKTISPATDETKPKNFRGVKSLDWIPVLNPEVPREAVSENNE